MQKWCRLIFPPEIQWKWAHVWRQTKYNLILIQLGQKSGKRNHWYIFTYSGVFSVFKCVLWMKYAWFSLILHFHTALVYSISLQHKIPSIYSRWQFSFSNTRSWLLCVIRSFSTLIGQTFENHKIYTISKTFCY